MPSRTPHAAPPHTIALSSPDIRRLSIQKGSVVAQIRPLSNRFVSLHSPPFRGNLDRGFASCSFGVRDIKPGHNRGETKDSLFDPSIKLRCSWLDRKQYRI